MGAQYGGNQRTELSGGSVSVQVSSSPLPSSPTQASSHRIDAILFLALPGESWHVIPQFVLVKLYFNSVLVSRQFLPPPVVPP